MLFPSLDLARTPLFPFREVQTVAMMWTVRFEAALPMRFGSHGAC